MKTITTFKDASAVQMSLDAVVAIPHKDKANFTAGVPIIVRTGQRLIVTTAGIWMEEFEEEYNEVERAA